jgi:hypothetical protein
MPFFAKGRQTVSTRQHRQTIQLPAIRSVNARASIQSRRVGHICRAHSTAASEFTVYFANVWR